MLIVKEGERKAFVAKESVRALINMDKKLILTINLYDYSPLEFLSNSAGMLDIFIFELLQDGHARKGPWANDRIKIEKIPKQDGSSEVNAYYIEAGYADYQVADLFDYLKRNNLLTPKDLEPEFTERKLSEFYGSWALYDHDANVYLDCRDYTNGYYVLFDQIPKRANPIVFVLAKLSGYEYWFVQNEPSIKRPLIQFFDETAGFSAFAESHLSVIPINKLPEDANAMKL